jgi:nitrite reductase/ring-hydroxylating ferredoxin subunit
MSGRASSNAGNSGNAMRIDAGRAADIVDGAARVVALPPEPSGLRREAFVVRDAAGELHAYLNRCQHLPITLDAGSRAFHAPDGRHIMCRTHGATYRLDDGMCIAGPCTGRALISLRLELDGERLSIVLDDAAG